MKKSKKQSLPAISDQVRQAVVDCGLTQYAISERTGISKSTLCRFVKGERGLPMNTLDTLGAFLRIEINTHGPIEEDS